MILIALLTISHAFSFNVVRDDQKDLAALADGFAVAMAKKDKVWMEANLATTCLTYAPSGETLDKQLTIKAFSGEIYDISDASANDKSFMVSGIDAGGSANYVVEGTLKSGGGSMDITGTYKLSLKFSKGDKGWQISEILINSQ